MNLTKLEIVYLPVTEIHPYEQNPRNNDKAVDKVADSIGTFGMLNPILIDSDGTIVCGHTRYLAAKRLGYADMPVVVVRNLIPAQIKAFRIADNKLAEIADWDLELLSKELEELEQLDFDLDSLGFDPRELNEIISQDLADGLVDPDEIPEPPDKPVTQPGDLWELGNHRLICGDSGNQEHLQVLLQGNPIHLVHTDPPYNVCVEPRSKAAMTAGNTSFSPSSKNRKRSCGKKIKLRAKDRRLENDFVSESQFRELLDSWFSSASSALLPGHVFYMWGGYSNCVNYPAALENNDLYFSQSIIWHKKHPVISRKDFMGDHEWCFYGWKKGAAHRFFGPYNATDVWSVQKVSPAMMVHLTEKPVELAVRAIQYSSLTGENVLDLFGGSGSTLIAATQTDRTAYLMEIDALYCDVIVQRWEQFTGQKARRIEAAVKPSGSN